MAGGRDVYTKRGKIDTFLHRAPVWGQTMAGPAAEPTPEEAEYGKEEIKKGPRRSGILVHKTLYVECLYRV